MPQSVRSRNLDLIRWLNLGHENTAKKLASATNATYLSKMATGDMEIGDRKARSIERALGLPSGWLDRDNVALLNMPPVDFQLYRQTSSWPEQAKLALASFLASVQR